MAAAAAEQGTNSFDDGMLRAVAEETRVRDYVGAHGMSWARPVEHQVEVFYNLHLTPWLQLTGDLQILRPNRPVADTAIVPGGRLRVVF